jgi:hypothetical protein
VGLDVGEAVSMAGLLGTVMLPSSWVGAVEEVMSDGMDWCL